MTVSRPESAPRGTAEGPAGTEELAERGTGAAGTRRAVGPPTDDRPTPRRRPGGGLARFLFPVGLALAAFAAGGVVGRYRVFPYRLIADGVKTFRNTQESIDRPLVGRFLRFVEVPPEEAPARRFALSGGGPLAGAVLWHGGLNRFLDLCPEFGCVAVEYTARGEVAHAYPYRVPELETALLDAPDDGFPFEVPPNFSFVRDIYVSGIHRYENGDLLVVFHQRRAFPYAAGAARLDRRGVPVWVRRDYSHHWPRIEPGGGALVPALEVGDRSARFDLGDRPAEIPCRTERPYRSAIHFLDAAGRLQRRLSVLGALLDSPFAPIVTHTVEPRLGFAREGCDPLHLNFVSRLGESAGGTPGIAPDDLVVSFRNVSAFAILDSVSGRLKRLARGTFFHQHSVQHLGGSRFLLFDNFGGRSSPPSSRILEVDLADGRERTVFPNDRTPARLRSLFTDTAGHLSLSPDRSRVLATFMKEGVAVEIRLDDGETPGVLRSLHDVSGKDAYPEERGSRSAVFMLPSVDYLPR